MKMQALLKNLIESKTKKTTINNKPPWENGPLVEALGEENIEKEKW